MGKCVVRIAGQPVRAATHAIAVPQVATVQERHAAGELCAHLAQITGETLPVCVEREVADRVPIVVGKCDLLALLGICVNFAALGEEGIHLQSKGPALALAGNRRGVLYAVSTLLEAKVLVARWRRH